MKNKDVIKQDNQAFIAEILDKREIRRDEIRNKRRRVKTFRSVAYIFQALSLLTATYFIYHYAKDYAGFYVALVWSVGVLLLFVIEAAKRFSILETAQGYYNPEDRHKTRWTPVIVIAIALSALVSYQGGSKFVVEENSGPALVHNARIDSISQLIAAQDATIAELKTSKWKGALTRGARDGINQANTIKAELISEQRRLQKRDEYMNEAIEKQHGDKFTAFGYIFGGFAGFLDLLLLSLLFWAEKDETDVERYARGQRSEPKPNAAPQRPEEAQRATLRAVSNDATIDRVTAQNIALEKRLRELTDIIEAQQQNAQRPEPQPQPATRRNAVTNDVTEDALLLESALEKARNNFRAYQSKLRNGKGNAETLRNGIAKWEKVIAQLEKQLQNIQ
jgi:hypothetical protein